MKFLITGSSGFIGKHLVNKLNGHKILRLPHDNFNVNLASLLCSHPDIDHIIHLSAYGNHSTQQDRVETFRANIKDTFTLLDLTADIPYKSFLNISTSSVYGYKAFSMHEDTYLEPRTMYACTKAAGENLARAFALTHNKPIVNVRPFSIYGEGEAQHRFIPTIVRSCLTGEPMKLDENGQHDWLHVDDFISGLLTLVERADEYKGEAFNIGSGKMFDNSHIVKLVTRFLSKEPTVSEVTPLRPNDSVVWRADISRMRALGWRPELSIEEGIKKTVNYYKNHYDRT